MIVCIIQARMGSTRLPGKALKKIGGMTALEHVIRRVKLAEMPDKIVLATPDTPEDHQLCEMAVDLGIEYHKGAEDDVLTSFYECATFRNADYVCRITADCVFIDPFWIDLACEHLLLHHPEQLFYVHNISPRKLPDGLDVEGFTFNALKKAYENTPDPWDREHVCHWMMDNCEKYSMSAGLLDLSHHRWTLDRPEDLLFMREVAKHLNCTPPNPTAPDLQNFLIEHPEIMEINQ